MDASGNSRRARRTGVWVTCFYPIGQMDMKKIFASGLLLLLACLSSPFAFSNETIRITNGEWPPYLSRDLMHNGFASHIVEEAFAIEGVTVQYGFFPWGRAYALVEEGVWDGSVVWTIKEERKEDVFFSDPVFYSPGVFLHRKDFQFQWNAEQMDFTDLQGKRIGTLIGSKHGPEFDRAEESGLIRVQRVVDDEQNIRLLLKGRIDVAMFDVHVAYHLLNERFSAEEAALLTHTPWLSTTDSYHLVLSKKLAKNEDLLQRFNRGLQKLRENGRYNQIVGVPSP